MLQSLLQHSIKQCQSLAKSAYQLFRRPSYGLLLGFTVGLLSCDDQAQPEAAVISMPYATMKAQTISQQQALIGIWGIQKEQTDKLYLVGGSQTPPKQVILTINQEKIKRFELDGEPLWWVFGLNENEIWACGGNGTILKLNADGTASQEKIDLPQELLNKTILWGLWGSDIHNMWAVGGSVRRGGAKGLLLKREDDGVWRRVSDPILPLESETDPLAGLNLYKVWGQGASKVWLVGEGGSAYFWDGTQLSRLTVQSALQEEGPLPLIFTLSGNQEYLWAVGGYDQGFAWKLNVQNPMAELTWQPEVFPWRTPPLNGVFSDKNELFMVGQQGSLIYQNHQNPQLYQRSFIQNAEDLTLHAVWKGKHLWIVGGDLESFTRGVLVSEQPLTYLDSE